MSFGALHVARTGLDAQSFRMQVIANNLANVNTTGFKRDRANFETLSYQMITQPGATAAADNRYATGLNLGTGVQLSGTSRIDTQGTFATTGNALDVALDGRDTPMSRLGRPGLGPRRGARPRPTSAMPHAATAAPGSSFRAPRASTRRGGSRPPAMRSTSRSTAPASFRSICPTGASAIPVLAISSARPTAPSSLPTASR